MTDLTRPLLVLYVIWHPDFAEGGAIADVLREHFRRKLYENIAGGTGLSVIYRYAAAPGLAGPLPIDLNEAETTAIVVLADPSLVADTAWTGYVQELVEQTEQAGLGARVFPVAIESGVLGSLGVAEQALRWDLWMGSQEEHHQQLTAELTYEFCRMLRHYLEHLKRPAEDEAARIVAAAKEEAAALLNDAEARKAELVTEIADKEGDLAELDSQLEDVKLDIEDEQDRLECLRQRADGVARDIGELQPIATEVRGWEAAGKAERGAILDRIAAQCDGLASRIRAGVAGMRIKVEELRSRISRPLEYLMRREQPRQQSLNDVLRDAQRAADAWNRDHAAPQRTYRGRAR